MSIILISSDTYAFFTRHPLTLALTLRINAPSPSLLSVPIYPDLPWNLLRHISPFPQVLCHCITFLSSRITDRMPLGCHSLRMGRGQFRVSFKLISTPAFLLLPLQWAGRWSCLSWKDISLSCAGRHREARQGRCFPGRSSSTLGPPALPGTTLLPQFLSPFSTWNASSSKWKSLQAPTPWDSCVVPMPLPGAQGKSCCSPLSHSCDSSQTGPWKKSQLLKAFQMVQQRHVDTARQCLPPYCGHCRANSWHYPQETPSALLGHFRISQDLIHGKVRHGQKR